MTDASIDLIERARAVPIESEIERRGIKLRGGADRCGPCPVCGGTDRFSINTKKQVFNCRGYGGGDVIALVQHLDGVDFVTAVQTLAGDRTSNNASYKMKPNGSARTADQEPKIIYGEMVPTQANEARRHVYPSPHGPIKIKLDNGRTKPWYSQWYRLYRDGVAVGWQNKRPDNYSPVPYRTTALDPFDAEIIGDEIAWPEGEKDVDTYNKLNLPAFTFGGVGDGLTDDVKAILADYVEERRLVIPADNDDAGRKHAENKARAAHKAGAASIKIIHFRELDERQDVSDFLAKGGTKEMLLARTGAAPQWEPPPEPQDRAGDGGRTGSTSGTDSAKAKDNGNGAEHSATNGVSPKKTSTLIRLSDIRPKATDWLWHLRLPRGAIAISAGEPGVGKSQQQCDIVAHVSTGSDWPDRSLCPCGESVMLTCEDSYERTIVPRALAAGADLTQIHALRLIRIDEKTERAFLLNEDLDELDRHLDALANPLLITIDPITGFVGSGKINSNSVTDIRGVLAPLAALAERRNIAIHVITHPPKATTTAMNAFIGSQAFIAASRMATITTKEIGEDDRPTGRYLVATVRSSLGPVPPTLAYRLDPSPPEGARQNNRTPSEFEGTFGTEEAAAPDPAGVDPDDAPPTAPGSDTRAGNGHVRPGRACAHCKLPFAPDETPVLITGCDGCKVVVHGACVEAFRLPVTAADGGLDERSDR